MPEPKLSRLELQVMEVLWSAAQLLRPVLKSDRPERYTIPLTFIYS